MAAGVYARFGNLRQGHRHQENKGLGIRARWGPHARAHVSSVLVAHQYIKSKYQASLGMAEGSMVCPSTALAGGAL